ncbi:MAG: STAS domain-containing protein [Salinibacterium sp.]|nr:STAS domain-containing protein [Salinibacterium sp.]
MDISVKTVGHDVAIVKVVGKLNVVSSPALRQIVAGAVSDGHSRIVVDLREVDFMDSSGLGAMISGLKAARNVGGDLKITGANDQVKLVLQLTNMERVLVSAESVDLAFADA